MKTPSSSPYLLPLLLLVLLLPLLASSFLLPSFPPSFSLNKFLTRQAAGAAGGGGEVNAADLAGKERLKRFLEDATFLGNIR
jgi:hypothetical protein